MPDITIKGLDGHSFNAYSATPFVGQGPGLLLVHDVYGLNKATRDLCDAFAEKGFFVICPDLYSRVADPSKELPQEDDIETALGYYKAFNIESGVRDLLAALAYIRSQPVCSGKVGVYGSCLGSRLAFLLASRSDVDCVVGYYGVGLDSLLDEVHDIRPPTLFHFAENDSFIPPSSQQKIQKAFTRNPVLHSVIHPGTDHGFARKGGQKYHPEAAANADKATETFLAEHLMR